MVNGKKISSKSIGIGKRLRIAARDGDYEACRSMLEEGAPINKKTGSNRRTPIMEASRCGHENIVKLLIQHGGEINLQDIEGKTALLFAMENNHDNISKTLIENGADIT